MTKTSRSNLLAQLFHLGPLLAALVLGALVGSIFGQTMWLASGGAEKRVDLIQKALAQLPPAADGKAGPAAERAQAHLQTELEETRQLIAARDKAGAPWWAGPAAKFLKFFGDLFLQLLKLLVLPLVVTSMISGIGGLGDIRGIGRMGRVTLLYFAVTTMIAVLIGLVLVVTIQPGRTSLDTVSVADERLASRPKVDPIDTILDLVIGNPESPGSGMFPANLLQAAYSTNVLGLIVFSLILGGALTTLGEPGRQAITFFATLNDAVLQMVRLVMHIAPLGIFALVASTITSKGGGAAFIHQVSQLGWYVGTVIIALGCQTIVLCVILRLVGQRPLVFVTGVGRALLTAFSTASSSATLPLSIESIEDNVGISKQSANFVLPLGATVNMNGTATYEAVAAVFIAQTLGIHLDGGQLLVVMVTATLAAVGAAGIPEAGLVTMVMVLTAVGLPTHSLGVILAVDWFLDRMRTTINVFGDMVGAAVTDRLVPETHRGVRV